ncbi:MAG: HvfB family MNIO-type RiPP peptide maturase [Methylococcales bacterium]
MIVKRHFTVEGAGLGLRRAFLDSLATVPDVAVDFYEVAPENWIKFGGRLGKQFRALSERFPFVSHGLSLSIGSPAPLDEAFILEIKKFLSLHRIRKYSEHLSYCSDDGHLYDLMPIPFTEEAVEYVTGRIRRVQDMLEQRIAIENVSYYAAPGKEMEEIDFLNAVLAQADCELLLDINNIYVNSVNHGYDAEAFLAAISADRIAYAHIAGHYVEAQDLIVDTHGAEVISPVWTLLEKAYRLHGVFPTLLERDFNIPSLPELVDEVQMIRSIQTDTMSEPNVRYG